MRMMTNPAQHLPIGKLVGSQVGRIAGCRGHSRAICQHYQPASGHEQQTARVIQRAQSRRMTQRDKTAQSQMRGQVATAYRAGADRALERAATVRWLVCQKL
jgi:hypothetical protein